MSAIVKAVEAKTMSSREIAELVESRHDAVKKSIERLVERRVIQCPPLANFKNINNVEGQEYLIGKRDSYVIVAQLSPEFTAKLVDRWQELESQAVQQFQIPTTLSGALLLASKQAEQLEQQALLIEAQKPAVEFHETVSEAINSQSIEEVAKVLGTGRNRLFDLLRQHKILRGNNLPYQEFIDRNLFKVVEKAYKDSKGEAHTYTRTLVTGKGIQFIQSNFSIN